LATIAGHKFFGQLDVEKWRLVGNMAAGRVWGILSPTINGTLSVASDWQRFVYLLLAYLFRKLVSLLQETRLWCLGSCLYLITPLYLSAEVLPLLRLTNFREVREEEVEEEEELGNRNQPS
jgi:hypothetical protein